MTLSEYAALLEKSRKADDLAVGQFLREHEVKLSGWLRDCKKFFRLKDGENEELLQTCLLWCVEAVKNGGGLNEVRNAMERSAYATKKWKERKVLPEKWSPTTRAFFGIEEPRNGERQ